ncbi:galactose-binding domain-like protein [Lipomyces orientalis]|uniref:Galactose-binding domain-like protein n=1 Tax=Lipomyces orientalis TaxID=1233043 RepID=A0ACC3TEM9_9ASCO
MDRVGNLSPTDPPALRPFTKINLVEGWSFKQVDDYESGTGWLPVNKVPSMVHQDLIDNQKLCDSFIGLNEIKAEWLSVPSGDLRCNSRIILAFDGLDTLAHVRLDGETVLKSNNMFRSYRADVTDIVKKKSEDHKFYLDVELDCAFLKAREIELAHPEHRWITFNGEPARMALRKAQYHWGWDWGPRLMPSGIWKPVRLEIYSARIVDVRVDVDISPDYETAFVRASAEIESETIDFEVKFFVRRDGKTIAFSAGNVENGTYFATTLDIVQPALWMPAGYG